MNVEIVEVICVLNIFDIGIILILIMFVVVGFKKGVIKESVSLIAFIIVFVLSWLLKGVIGNFLCIYFPFFKFSGVISGLSSLNILIYQLIAFIIVFGFLLGFYSLVLKISKVFQKIVNMTLVLWIPSKILGALVSFIKGYLCVFICLVFLIIPLGGSNIYQDSNMINYILYKTPILSNFTSSFVNPINEIYSLSEDVSNNKISVNDANIRAISIMLKYKVVNYKTLDIIYNRNKLENVDGLDSILHKEEDL